MIGLKAGALLRPQPAGRTMAGMAYRRDAARYRWRLLATGLLLTGLLAGAIQLGNAVTVLRRQVLDLARANRNSEARQAQLTVLWNAASCRQVVLRRAHEELGLVDHEAPEAILVSMGDGASQPLGWPRWLHRLGPSDPLAAAQAAPDRP